MTDLDAPTAWTPSARDRFRTSRDALVAALERETDLILAAPSMGEEALQRSTDAVYRAAVDYSETHYELTNQYGIVGVWDEDAGAEFEFDFDEPEPAVAEVVSVILRSDYAIENEDFVLAAGRSAWLKGYPDASDDDLLAHVGHIGGALYAIAHDGGWEHLERVEGMRPLGGMAKVVSPADYDSAWLEGVDWDDSAAGFTVPGEVLYSESDRF